MTTGSMKKGSGVTALAAVQRIAKELPGAEQYVMVHHPAFRVGKKPFVVLGMQLGDERETVSINLGREAQYELLGDARFQKTPYMHQHGWVTIAYAALRSGELDQLVVESWKRIANRKQLAEREGVASAPRASAGAKKSTSSH